jgi:hypothetical protein
VAIATLEGPIPSGAQSAPANEPDSVSIHISLQKSSYAIGEKPIAVMTIHNISSNEIWFSNASYLERIHVTSKDGEPPKTELHRHILGDFRPGDGPGLLSGPVAGWSIAPGSVDAQKYDLTYFYDLSKPGFQTIKKPKRFDFTDAHIRGYAEKSRRVPIPSTNSLSPAH